MTRPPRQDQVLKWSQKPTSRKTLSYLMRTGQQYKVFAGDEMEIRLPDEQASGEVNNLFLLTFSINYRRQVEYLFLPQYFQLFIGSKWNYFSSIFSTVCRW